MGNGWGKLHTDIKLADYSFLKSWGYLNLCPMGKDIW